MSGRRVSYFWQRGKHGRNWYESTLDALTDQFGTEKGILLIGFLAATSANTTVTANWTLALKALGQYERGEEFKGFLPFTITNLNRVVRGEYCRGLKLEAYHRALLGDETAVVVDRWMLRAYDLPVRLTPSRYRLVVDNIRKRAKLAKVSPRQYQAGVWVGIKRSLDPYKLNNAPYEERA